MREIKFRLRDGNKVVGYERWNSLAGKWCYDIRSDGVFDIRNPFIPHTDKDQFTGLKDKNGIEIYEGDMVQTPYGKFEVKWLEYAWWLQRTAKEGFTSQPLSGAVMEFPFEINKSPEVIGNIYENPELLEGK